MINFFKKLFIPHKIKISFDLHQITFECLSKHSIPFQFEEFRLNKQKLKIIEILIAGCSIVTDTTPRSLIRNIIEFHNIDAIPINFFLSTEVTEKNSNSSHEERRKTFLYEIAAATKARIVLFN